MPDVSTKDMEEIFNSLGILSDKQFHIVEAGAGMARILQHIKTGIPFFIISAFRSEYSKNMNVDMRTKQLSQDIQAYNLGFIQLRGHWIDDPRVDEEGNTTKGEDTYENSLFVNAFKRKDGVVENTEDNKYTVDELQQIAQSLAEKYDQRSYIFGDGKDIFEIFTDGSKKNYLGNQISIKQEVLQGPYSDIKGKKFVFSHTMLPKINNYIDAMGWTKQGYIACRLTKQEKDFLNRK